MSHALSCPDFSFFSYRFRSYPRSAADGHGLKANWFASESHFDDESADNRDNYTYFFNLCAPLVNIPEIVTNKIAYFGGDVGVLQVSCSLLL